MKLEESGLKVIASRICSSHHNNSEYPVDEGYWCHIVKTELYAGTKVIPEIQVKP